MLQEATIKPYSCCRYNHKLIKLAEAVLREVVDFTVEEDRFQVSLPHYIITPRLALLDQTCNSGPV